MDMSNLNITEPGWSPAKSVGTLDVLGVAWRIPGRVKLAVGERVVTANKLVVAHRAR
jgi:hypothetical protein